MFCPSCGKSIHDSSRFCQHCGSPIDLGEPKPRNTPSDAPRDVSSRLTDVASNAAAVSLDDAGQAAYAQYTRLAESVGPSARAAFKSTRGTIVKWALLSLAVGIILLLPMLSIPSAGSPTASTMSASTKNVTLGLALISILFIGAAIYGAPLAYIVARWRSQRRAESEQAARIDETHPGFLKFYIAWKQNKRQDQLTVIGALALLGVLIGIDGAINDADEERRIRSAVDKELKRHNL